MGLGILPSLDGKFERGNFLPLLDEFNNFLMSLEAALFYNFSKEFALI